MDLLPALLAVVVALLPAASARGPEASLECTCKSTHFDDVHFALKCQRTIEKSEGGGVDFMEKSAVSCKREPPPPPPTEYELKPGLGYYKFHPELKTWQDALVTCTREGATLARVRNKEEEDHLASLMRPFPNLAEGWTNDQAWLIFNDLDKEGTFVAPDGTTLESLNYANWQPGDPNNSGNNEDCVSLIRNGKMNDSACGTLLAFFCYRKA